MGPVMCLVTGGGQGAPAAEAALAARVAAAARAGVQLIQVRERHVEGRALWRLVRRCVEAVASTRARVLVNDRLDVALAAGAHGVHLRGDSMPGARVRAVAPAGFLIGRSVHDVREAVRAAESGGLDYLVFGAVFPTSSKPGHTGAGVQALADVVAATALPVLAVGGIGPGGLAAVRQAGAAGFAAIGLFADAPLEALPSIVGHAARAFDAPGAA